MYYNLGLGARLKSRDVQRDGSLERPKLSVTCRTRALVSELGMAVWKMVAIFEERLVI